MTQEQFIRLREIELDILQEFQKVCDTLHLRYFCIYGTALGAIRHKGFIPWDDDLDVGMPREDYDIFMEKAQALLPEHYFVQNHLVEKEYCLPFGKIRRSDTTFLLEGSKNANINHGVYIDIFPLDGYPDSKWSEFIFKWKRLVYNTYIHNGGVTDPKESAVNKLLIAIGKGFTGKLTAWEAVVKKDALVRQMPYATSTRVGVMVEDNPSRETVPKEYFGDGVSVAFEDRTAIVPTDWDSYLRHAYGDYMTPPPEGDRVPLHTCAVIDLERPYTHYTAKEPTTV